MSEERGVAKGLFLGFLAGGIVGAAQRRIVVAQAAFRVFRVYVIHLVHHLGEVGKDQVAMREAARDEKLLLILGRQNDAEGLPAGSRVGTDVDRDIVDLT